MDRVVFLALLFVRRDAGQAIDSGHFTDVMRGSGFTCRFGFYSSSLEYYSHYNFNPKFQSPIRGRPQFYSPTIFPLEINDFCGEAIH